MKNNYVYITLMPAFALLGLLLLLACKDPDVVQAGGTVVRPPASTTVTTPVTATTAVVVPAAPSALSGLLQQVVQQSGATSQTTTFSYESLSPGSTPAGSMLLSSYTTVSGSPSSTTVLIVSLIRSGTLVTGQRETRSEGNRLISGVRSMTYNEQGLLTRLAATDQISGKPLTEEFTYDASGQLRSWQRIVGTGNMAASTASADIVWQGTNVRFVRQEDSEGNVEETTWQAENLPNYRRRFSQTQGLPPGYGPDLLNANSPTQATEQFSGRRSRYEYLINQTDQLTGRLISEMIKGQWVVVTTETYTYY